MRILHASRNVADQAGATVRALRRLGYEAELWEYDENPFGFAADRTIPLDRERRDPTIFWQTFLDAIERFDVFHFHFARTLVPTEWGGLPAFWDLPIYRILGKRVFFTFHGSDVRIRRIHERVNPWSYYKFSDLPAEDDRTEKVIAICRAYADGLFVVSVDYRHFVPEAEFLPRVIDLADWPPRPPEQRSEPVVLHVPSRRGTKGTDLILAALDRLRATGLAFEVQLLEGVPHAEARRAIQEADVVVDNVLTGDYEVVSIEAMASSRVAVANVGPDVQAAFPDVPVVPVTPETFEPVMRDLIGDVDRRRRLAAAGRPFVERVHAADVVAPRLVEAYRRAPRPPDAAQPSFPDWLRLAPAARIERLERELGYLRSELARTRFREEELRRRLGLQPLGPVDAWFWPTLRYLARAALPEPIRRPLHRLRSRLRRR